jgi:uncharacterized delta-60 repeat protein
MPRARTLALLVTVGLTAATAGAPASAADAPGRVAFGVSARVANVDARGAEASVALPDGGAALVTTDRNSLTVARLRADGSMEPAFGTNGVARFAVPGGVFAPRQLLRQPDGRLLVVGSRAAAATDEQPRFVLARVTATGTLDPSFGGAGFVAPELQYGGAALAPDGSIVLNGNTGKTSFPAPNQPTTFQWVVQRLTPAGATDAAFGSIAMPGQTGADVVVRPSGAIVALGADRGVAKLVGLTAAGTPDVTFNGGQSVTVADGASQSLLRASGAIEVLGSTRLFRFTTAGTPDPAFGGGGVAFGGPLPLAPAMLPAPDGGTTIYWNPASEPTPPGRPRLHVQHITAAGTLGGAADLSPQLGGGVTANGLTNVSHRQNALRGARLLARPDGSYLAVGGLSIQRYTGEGTGFSIGLVAVAALTPLLAPDPSFGGAQEAPVVHARVPRQRARTALTRGGVRVGVGASGPGLVRLRVRDGRRRIIAQSVEPIFTTRSFSVRVPLTATGRRILRHARNLRVLLGYDFRDVLTGRARDAVAGRLR